MKQTQKNPLIVGVLIILILALSGCSSILGPARPIYSYPTEGTSAPEPEPTPVAPQTKPTPQPEPPKPATPPEEFVFQADADGVTYVSLADWPFSIKLTDPLIILFDAEQTGTYEITHEDFALFPLYMSIYSFDQDDAIAHNLINNTPIESIQVSLEAGNTYIFGVGLLTPQHLNKTTRFSIEYLGAGIVPKSDSTTIANDRLLPPEIDVQPVEKLEIELEKMEGPKLYPIHLDTQTADGSQAVQMTPFKDNPAIASKSEIRGNIEGVLTVADSPYTVTGNSTVASGKSLVIEEGVLLRFANQTTLQVYGKLDVKGSSGNEVVFTSNNSAEAGSWGGIIFHNNSKASLNHARILYAGKDIVVEGAWRKSAIYTLGNAAPTVTQSQIAHSGGDIIQLFGSSSPSVTQSDFNEASYVAKVHSPSASFNQLQSNRYTSIKNHGIKLTYQNVNDVETVLKSFDNIPYYSEGIRLNQNASMTLAEGVILKFGNGNGFEVAGTLRTAGAEGKPVVLTSANDDIGGDTNGDGTQSKPEAGQWRGIYADNNGKVDLQKTVLRYTGKEGVTEGAWRKAALVATNNASITMVNTEITHSGGDGLLIFRDATASVSRTLFESVRWPIRLFGPNAMPTIVSGNQYVQVENLGIRLDYQKVGDGQQTTLVPFDRLPYYSEGMRIDRGASMTLAEGVILKFGNGNGFEVAGTLKAEGIVGKPVILTSANDDIDGDTNGDGNQTKGESGQWRGIYADNSGKVDLQRTAIRYAGKEGVSEGAWRKAALFATNNASITVNNSEISYSADGVMAFRDAQVKLNNTALNSLQGKGAENNSSLTLDARQLWWGNSSGPRHESNPSGNGYEITGDVSYLPYLKNRPEL